MKEFKIYIYIYYLRYFITEPLPLNRKQDKKSTKAVIYCWSVGFCKAKKAMYRYTSADYTETKKKYARRVWKNIVITSVTNP
jgi:hypothetical protein